MQCLQLDTVGTQELSDMLCSAETQHYIKITKVNTLHSIYHHLWSFHCQIPTCELHILFLQVRNKMCWVPENIFPHNDRCIQGDSER